MPTYVCSAAIGRLTPVQKAEIARSITAIHHEETGAPRYLVQVIFYDLAPDSHYVAGQLAPAAQIWARGDIRGGRTNEQKSQMLRRIMQAVSRASGAAEDAVWVYVYDIPAASVAEYGRTASRAGGRMVLVATRRDARKA
jgi:phenylpyruvate tautomerase PptA (4-oxalocrotonate tautomerase family)